MDEEEVRKFADHFGFTVRHRSDGFYYLYSRYPDADGTPVCKTKSLRGIVRFLYRWGREELRR
jgi:hypothetical protein